MRATGEWEERARWGPDAPRRFARRPARLEGMIHAGLAGASRHSASRTPRRPDGRRRTGHPTMNARSASPGVLDASVGPWPGRWRRIVAARRCAGEMSFKTCGQSTAGRRTPGTIHGRRRQFGQVLSAGRNLGRRCRFMAGRTGCVWSARRLPSERAGPFLFTFINGGESGRRVDALGGRRASPGSIKRAHGG